jgi:MFS family permease
MKNISIGYALAALNQSWFWLGIWVFFYLLHTDYAGIGIIETVMISTSILAEIPTGAISDLVGKKRALLLAFFLGSVGNVIMGFSTSLPMLALSAFTMTVGASFYSGTFEAFMYDTLKSLKKEKLYDHVISRANTFANGSLALASIIGGFLYTFDPRLPFFMVAGALFLAFVLTLLLKEPAVETDHFSLKGFIQQNRQGFKQLFYSKPMIALTVFLLSVAIFSVNFNQFLNDFLAIDFGFQPTQLGVFSAVVYLVAAFGSHLTPSLTRPFGHIRSVIFITILFAVTSIVSPYIGIIIGAGTILLRVTLMVMFQNISSALINKAVDSKYRATTISTFNMLANIPYVLTAYLIGSMIDTIGSVWFTFYLGISLIFLVLLQLYLYQLIKPVYEKARTRTTR